MHHILLYEQKETEEKKCIEKRLAIGHDSCSSNIEIDMERERERAKEFALPNGKYMIVAKTHHIQYHTQTGMLTHTVWLT